MPGMRQGAMLRGGIASSHAETHWGKTNQVSIYTVYIVDVIFNLLENAIFRCPYCPWMGSSSSELNKHKTALHKLEREREKMKKQLFHAGHTVGQYAVGQSDAIQ